MVDIGYLMARLVKSDKRKDRRKVENLQVCNSDAKRHAKSRNTEFATYRRKVENLRVCSYKAQRQAQSR